MRTLVTRLAVLSLIAGLGSALVPASEANALHFTIDVAPDSDLVEGQHVVVTITGIPVGESFYIAECLSSVATIDSCDLSTLSTRSMVSDPFEADFVVHQFARSTQTGAVNCLEGAATCYVAVAPLTNISDYRTAPISFVAAPSGTIDGTVTDWGGAPVAGAGVQKFPCNEGGSCLATVTDAAGHYRFDDVVAGDDIEIWVSPPQSTYLLSEPVNGETGPPPGFTLGPDEALVHDVVLGRGGRIEVRPTLRGTPVDFGYAEVCSAPSACWQGYFSRFALAMPPGDYELTISSFTGEPLPAQDPVAVTVVADETTIVPFAIVAGHLTGRVTDSASGAGISDALVRLSCGDGCPEPSGVTDSDGYYSVWAFPGDYEIEVSSQSIPGTKSDVVTLADGDDIVRNYQLDAPPTLHVVAPGATIMGVDACEVDGPGCVLGGFNVGDSYNITPVVPGERYDLFVDAVVNGNGGTLSTLVVTDVDVGEGVTTITVPIQPDSDRDGAINAVEAGDRDGNGVLDDQDLTTVTAEGSDGSLFTLHRLGYAPVFDLTFTWMVGARDSALVPPPPDGIEFPHGVMTARMNSISSAVVKLVLPDSAEAFYLQTDDGWERADGAGLGGATLAGNRATLRVFDGSRADLDGAVNGRVQINFAPATNGVDGAAITDGPVGFIEGNDADFLVDAPDGAALRCSLDMHSFVACDDSPSYSNLADGMHVLVVQPMVDGHAGRPDFRLWFAGMPVGRRATGGPTGVTSATSATFTMTGPQTHDTICIIDFAELFECGAGSTRSGFEEGPHVLFVFDGSGPDGLSDLRYWSVDRPADAN
jgi:hypothetical protein